MVAGVHNEHHGLFVGSALRSDWTVAEGFSLSGCGDNLPAIGAMFAPSLTGSSTALDEADRMTNCNLRHRSDVSNRDGVAGSL
mgnify:CR=1 FL=1